MLTSYITIALRRLQRESTYVAINIFSLALGIASFLVLGMYLRSELTYDRYHENGDRIYRLVTHFKNASSDQTDFAVSQLGFGPLFTQDYPQVGKFVRFQVRNPGAPQVLVHGDKEYYRVLGASEWQIVGRLARPVMLLVVLAAVPASFVSYDAINRWLLQFAYYEPVSPGAFGIAGIVVAAVTFLTVIFQARKAIRAEPVEALRHE